MIDKKLHPWIWWFLGCCGFGLTLYLGTFTYEGEKIYLWDYAPKLFKDTKNSLLLIIPSIFVTSLIVVLIFGASYFANYASKTRQFLLLSINSLPTIFSSIPLFITAIVLIRYLHLDTIHSYNFFYGILCLSLFNVGYLYNKLEVCLKKQLQEPYVMYAKSLGLPKKHIFYYYVFPGLIPHIFVTLRELLPHIIVESIVIEYTFSYNALLRSAVQALQYDNWHYLILFFYVIVLCISFFEIVCRSVEKKYQI
ncbi:ABC transporter permease subunit [Candidatus Uabimicrobium sp. HlEnr_7]|uniref:ABC transporter permease subunit n=1 Tax=Candidatus Uabimicrobium helgolandensis TaxID=3095367 RepID=UPI003558878B